MQFVNSTGSVITDVQFRALYPLTSFPATIGAVDVAPYGYFPVVPSTPPAASPFYTVTEGTPTENAGVWTQTWVSAPVSLAQAQASQAQALNAACANAIISGFTSSALGSAYTYPSGVVDQQNLTASVLASMLPNAAGAGWTTPFWCATGTPAVWAWTNHTAAQIQQVGSDAKAAILALQSQNATLQAQVAAATTVDAVAAITWTA
jgi:hypothetical protein